MNVRDILIKLRDERGLSQQELAEKLNVSRQTVTRWEAGKNEPSSAQIANLCQTFGLDAATLLSADSTAPLHPTQEQPTKRPIDASKIALFAFIGVLLVAAVVGLVLTVLYAFKDAAYDTVVTAFVLILPQNFPMIVLTVFLGLFIAAIVGVLIYLLRRNRS